MGETKTEAEEERRSASGIGLAYVGEWIVADDIAAIAVGSSASRFMTSKRTS
jgi:hypothetical protein